MSFFGELKRRKTFQVVAVYAVVAWLLVQIVATVEQPLNLPNWFDTAVIVLLAVAFPITLIISWAFDATTEGFVRDKGGKSGRHGSHLIEYALLGLIIVAAGWISYREFGFSSQPTTAPGGTLSIAVLPLVNLSGDPDQEVLSDGLTEEISFALARVEGLDIVGRTSVFQFKNVARDLREIGRALDADYLIEGTVQTSGTLVRVTPKLIRSDSGREVWTDRVQVESTDLFELQEQVARAVVASLEAPLGLSESKRLVANRSIDAQDYREYLRARDLFRTRGLVAITEAAKLLEGVVDRNADYAPAWALLAQAYDFIPNFEPAWLSGDFESLRPIVLELAPKAEAAAMRAIELDEELASGFNSLALLREQQGRLTEAEDLYQRALGLDRNDPDSLHLYSRLLAKVGRLEEALAMRERLSEVEPFVDVYQWVYAFVLWLNGRDSEAIAMAENVPTEARSYTLSRMLASMGRYEEAAEIVQSSPEGMYLPGTTNEAARLLRIAPTAVPSPDSLPNLGLLAFAYLYAGAPERALEPHEGGVEVGYSVGIFNAFLWHTSYAALRKTDRFEKFLRSAGIVDYWRERGWPEFCRPLGPADFECS